MNKKLAELVVEKSADYKDYNDKMIKALEDAGFAIVFDTEISTQKFYIVAEKAERSDKE